MAADDARSADDADDADDTQSVDEERGVVEPDSPESPGAEEVELEDPNEEVQHLVAAEDASSIKSADAAGDLSGRELRYSNPRDSPKHPGSKEAEEGRSWLPIFLRVAASVLLFAAGALVLDKVASKYVSEASRVFVNNVGLPGLFLTVLCLDGVPQPFTYVPLIFLAVEGAVPKHVVFLVCLAGSYLAALCGYGIGACLRGPEWGRRVFDRLAEKHPFVPDLMQRRGAVGVFLAAMMPLPLAVSTWTAGFFGISFPHFLLAALGRCPKIALVVLLSPTSQSAP